MDQRDTIIKALGEARLQPYLVEAGGNKKHALRLYRWSIELSTAVQAVLGPTEVILRNAIDNTLQQWNSAQYGQERSWLLEPPAAPLRSLTSRKREEALRRARKAAERRSSNHPRYGERITHDDVLAHTMFGLWKDLLPNHLPEANPQREGNRNRIRLWDEAIHQAFPYTQDHDGARTFWRVFHLHELRNRVSHMDSLLNTNVHDRTNEAFDLVESINPHVQEWLSGTSTVRSVLRKHP